MSVGFGTQNAFGSTESSSQTPNQQVDLERRVSELERQLMFVNSDNFRPEPPASRQKEDSDKNTLQTKITELTWDTHIRSSGLEPDPTGRATSSASGDDSYVYLPVRTPNLVNQNRESRIRFGASILSTVSGVNMYMIMNAAVDELPANGFSDDTSFIAIKVTDGVCYGVHRDPSNGETLVDLNYTHTSQEYDQFEIHTLPGQRSDFYINGEFKGSLGKNYPNTYDTDDHIMIPVMFYIQNTSAAVHTADVDFYEYIQKRQ